MRKKNTILGICAVYLVDHARAYLTLIAVRPDSQGLGVASFLLKEMESYLRDLNFCTVELEVYKTNSNALKLYSKFGYQTKAESEHSYYLIKYLNITSENA
ncbi:GNAT family N-acetyltransferase [Vibrio parahaemolyticus]|nr:GNAT family N-acetyltransferase [Vibrio parahaemolyticus]